MTDPRLYRQAGATVLGGEEEGQAKCRPPYKDGQAGIL